MGPRAPHCRLVAQVSDWFKDFILDAPVGPKPSMPEIFGKKTQTAYSESPYFSNPNGTVSSTRDLERVLALPRREPFVDEGKPRAEALELIEHYTAALGTGLEDCQCEARFHRRCAKRLLPMQAWAVHEMRQTGGLFAPIAVGDGKTLLDLLSAMVVPNVRTALLLVPASLKSQLLSVDWEFYSQHWKLPNLAGSKWAHPGRPWLYVMSYSELSTAKNTVVLTEQIRPDLIILDEAHNLASRKAARTMRFLAYMRKAVGVRVVCWSGTMVKRSMKDYAHLSNLALKEGSPCPLHEGVLLEWAGAIDEGELFKRSIGALVSLCKPGEHIQVAWQRRLKETPGVVMSPATQNCPASLVFSERKVELPAPVADALRKIDATWTRPDGEELVEAIEKYACMRQMACGFYYRWVFPRNEAKDVIDRWLLARAEWHRELRERLKNPRPHMDSPLLLTKAAIRWYKGYVHVDEKGERHEVPPFTARGPMPTWRADAWPEWLEVRDTVERETEAVWVDRFLVEDSADWVRSNNGIVWYEHDAFGRSVAGAAKVAHYGPGEKASAEIIRATGRAGIVTSIRAHGTGKNLQMFADQLVSNPPSDGATWEQLLGRTHRQGQLADEVNVRVYRHCDVMRAALDAARDKGRYIQNTMGGSQKLLRATYLFDVA